MQKYYKTLRTSSTGAKFAEKEQISFLKDEYIEQLRLRYGFTDSYTSHYVAIGGIEQVAFDTTPDKTLWSKGYTDGVYRPRLSTKQGKQVMEYFNACPTVDWDELNECVGIGLVHVCIGHALSDDVYFGFIVDDSWDGDWLAPEDCEEITCSEYRRLFGADDNN